MSKLPDTIKQAAIRWYMQMRDAAPDAPERTAFETWLLADVRHQSAYRLVTSTMEDFTSTDRLKNLSDALTQQQYFEKTQRSRKLTKLGSGMAVLLLCLGLGWFGQIQYAAWQAMPIAQHTQNTAVAQISQRKLEDGSVVTANANSELDIIFYRHQRVVHIKRGEAIFDVAKDSERPFIVQTAQAKVTVLGTRFAVNQLANRVRVSVDHGRVQVARADDAQAPLLLRDGEVAEIVANDVPKRVNRHAGDGFGFAQGLIVFDQADMQEVAETLSRYRQQPIQAKFFGQTSPNVNAVLKTKEINDFIRGLPQSLPVTLQQTSEQLVIQPRP
ncbi:Fe2+-dicitrate sensor, membrane component [Methylophilaceae bacterium 11]|jgi:transmembrane sensor|uniref:FecR family protein n=1 Tax=Methylotenera sp. N17 TaxID=1502761 RepID=UPI000449F65E|nr:FecR domain-containing protein [Methylotenera sp. N17]EUJ11100.1 Fe2+-dicitrate sensor, membrane component [Methylophilaceae bacterium 11]